MFHNMTDKDWKDFCQAESDIGAARIMQQVNADPTLKNVHASEELWESLKKKIDEYEQSKEDGQ